MLLSDVRVSIAGQWVDSVAYCSDIEWSGTWGAGPNGPALASCTIDVDPANDTSWLRLGAVFEVWVDGVKEFGGPISEMGRGYPREVHAKGWARTREVDTSIPGTRWGVDANNVDFTPVDPTTPTWWLDASDLDIGVADDALYTRVVASYVSAIGPEVISTVTIDDTAAQALYDVITFDLDLTPLGLISSGTATTYAQNQLDELLIPQWLSRVTTNSDRLLSEGGLPAHLPSVKEGQMVRLFNVPNNLGGLRHELALDVTLGEVEHSTANPLEVTIAPVRLAVRNLADVVAQIAKLADAAGVA